MEARGTRLKLRQKRLPLCVTMTRAEIMALLFDPPFLEALAAGHDLSEAARIGTVTEPLPAAA